MFHHQDGKDTPGRWHYPRHLCCQKSMDFGDRKMWAHRWTPQLPSGQERAFLPTSAGLRQAPCGKVWAGSGQQAGQFGAEMTGVKSLESWSCLETTHTHVPEHRLTSPAGLRHSNTGPWPPEKSEGGC